MGRSLGINTGNTINNNTTLVSYNNISATCNIGDTLYCGHTIILTDEEFKDYQKWKAKFQLRKVSFNAFIWDYFWACLAD